MIKGIVRLKKFGIFTDYKQGDVKDFNRRNLIYGWNGSGKSTLATLLQSIEKKQVPDQEKFGSCEFDVACGDNTSITSENVTDSNLNLCTFNKTFVEENIDWNKSVQSILLVAKEKIEDINKLKEQKEAQSKETKNHTAESLKIRELEKKLSNLLTKTDKQIKTNLQVIDTKDSHYLYYNKTKLESLIKSDKELLIDQNSIQSDEALVEITNAAKPNQLPLVNLALTEINLETYKKAHHRLIDLLGTSVTAKTIQRLKDNLDIQIWVSDGFDLFKKHKPTNCEFYGNEISDERIEEIDQHFSDEFKQFKIRLKKAEEWLAIQFVKTDSLVSNDKIYEELQSGYIDSCQQLETAAALVNKELEAWSEELKKKIDNPFDTKLIVEEMSDDCINKFNAAVKKVLGIGNQHDKKTQNFEKETNESKRKLELHYATSEFMDFKYFNKLENLSERKKNNADLLLSINQRKTEIQDIQNSLSDEGVGAEQFNESLHRFIGRSELSLRFNKEKMGYEIIRNNEGEHDGNLSEGEKTAIAFVYFITKLTEKDNKKKSGHPSFFGVERHGRPEWH